eukprot:CAMPEP_0194395030 /NCGR_PEP_ID=MMETSP0174-20130528/124192_1 /TAXON_ID=216777 /ORGANISM="Proboscia alata, Strain PI-D3" /LENGTH=271 /DNA_ID=CAMNT_0039190909 /DNA_START=955 /DNA_END=1770 /DNA_ORIENTATION=+
MAEESGPSAVVSGNVQPHPHSIQPSSPFGTTPPLPPPTSVVPKPTVPPRFLPRHGTLLRRATHRVRNLVGIRHRPLPANAATTTDDDHNQHDWQSPEQLPVVLQVLLSQAHRVRALVLLRKFLDLGPWAVNAALSVGIFPYVLKLLQSPIDEYKHVQAECLKLKLLASVSGLLRTVEDAEDSIHSGIGRRPQSARLAISRAAPGGPPIVAGGRSVYGRPGGQGNVNVTNSNPPVFSSVNTHIQSQVSGNTAANTVTNVSTTADPFRACQTS